MIQHIPGLSFNSRYQSHLSFRFLTFKLINTESKSKVMKNIGLFLSILFSNVIWHIQAQPTSGMAPCLPGTSTLEVKNGQNDLNQGNNGTLIHYAALGGGGFNWVSDNGLHKGLVYSSSIWMGGVTDHGEIKFAGTTYRTKTDNFDWYNGPLDENGETSEENCKIFDRIFLVYRSEILEAYKLMFDLEGNINAENCINLPQSILLWPAKGNPNWPKYYGYSLQEKNLASFFDYNNDGIYNPCDGDLPCLETNGEKSKTPLNLIKTFPEFLTFNVINDNGGSHRLSAGNSLKMEVQVYAFGYPNEEMKDNTLFFQFKTKYKGEEPLNDVYLSMWVDPNLGCYNDDYIGTNSAHDLMYIYNKDTLDGNEEGGCPGADDNFNGPPPIIAFHYLKGFEVQNDSMGSSQWKDAGLTSSIYFYNCAIGSPVWATCDPEHNDLYFYRLMKGKWKDGLPITKSGTGYNPGSSDSTNFVFDGNPNNPNDWTMCTFAPQYYDLRFLMTTGGGKMTKGATNEAIVAITLTHDEQLPCPEIKNVIKANEDIKNLFNNNWQKLNGPYAPDLNIDQKEDALSFKISNNPKFNNKDHSYKEKIPNKDDLDENYYQLEGYQIYQVNSPHYDVTNLQDTTSVLIFQCDKQNNTTEVFNWEYTLDSLNNKIWKKTKQVSGSNQGIDDHFIIQHDFLEGGPIKQNKEYYYVALAYAYNNYAEFDQQLEEGQRMQYLKSKDNVKVYSITPKKHNIGQMAKITRIHGEGTYNFLKINPSHIDSLIMPSYSQRVEYLPEFGPFDIIVIDSTKINNGNKYSLRIIGPFSMTIDSCEFNADNTFYEIIDHSNGVTYKSDQSIKYYNDQYFEELGLLVSFHQPNRIGENSNTNGGFFKETFIYKDELGPKWFSGLKDLPDSNPFYPNSALDPASDIIVNNQTKFTSEGYFFPLYSAKYNKQGEAKFTLSTIDPDLHAYFTGNDLDIQKLRNLNNVDIVFTSDQSKWSRCIVVETASSIYSYVQDPLEDNSMLTVRSTESIGKNGLPDNTKTKGFSWFPGYVVDVEKGERLNVFFGENTCLRNKNWENESEPQIVTDMIFNPNSELLNKEGSNAIQDYFAGGQHYLYITRQAYDGCAQMYPLLNKPKLYGGSWNALSSITWSGIPLLKENCSWLPIENGLIPNDLTISLRVEKPFFFAGKNDKPLEMRNCSIESEYPLYQFEIASNVATTTKDPKGVEHLPWSFSYIGNGFHIYNVSQKCSVDIFNLQGQLISKTIIESTDDLKWFDTQSLLPDGLIFIRVKSSVSGLEKVYKMVYLNY